MTPRRPSTRKRSKLYDFWKPRRVRTRCHSGGRGWDLVAVGGGGGRDEAAVGDVKVTIVVFFLSSFFSFINATVRGQNQKFFHATSIPRGDQPAVRLPSIDGLFVLLPRACFYYILESRQTGCIFRLKTTLKGKSSGLKLT